MLARLVIERGAVQQQSGNHAEAAASLREGLALLDALPPSPGARQNRAVAELRLAGLAVSDSRMTEVPQRLAAARAAIAGNPRDYTYELSIGAIEYLETQYRYAVDDLAGARVHGELALQAARSAQRLSPWRPDSYDTIARTQSMIASIAVQQGELAVAAASTTEAVEVMRRLREFDPTSAVRIAGLANALGDLANVRDRVAANERRRSRARR